MIITIDGTNYDLNIKKLVEEDTFVDKYAERTESYDLERELVGLFCNYRVTIGNIQDRTQRENFMQKIRQVVPFHTVTMPFNNTTITFKAYITGVTTELLHQGVSYNTWGGFEVRFIAKSPQFLVETETTETT